VQQIRVYLREKHQMRVKCMRFTKEESIRHLVTYRSVMLDAISYRLFILEQALQVLFLHDDALSHACNASFHGVRISTKNSLKFLA